MTRRPRPIAAGSIRPLRGRVCASPARWGAACRPALLLMVVFCAWLFLTRLQFPKTNGRMAVEGLRAPVEVLRDRYGVPHIYARSAHDIWFAEGFVHAQDRFWQMEFWRRLGAGRLSELFGKTTLETDKFLRTLGIRKVAEAEFEQYSAESKGYFEAYSAGVYAYIMHRQPWRLGLVRDLLCEVVRVGYMTCNSTGAHILIHCELQHMQLELLRRLDEYRTMVTRVRRDLLRNLPMRGHERDCAVLLDQCEYVSNLILFIQRHDMHEVVDDYQRRGCAALAG